MCANDAETRPPWLGFRARGNLCWIVGLTLFWGWFCWPFFGGSSTQGFRDTPHFYYPLFHWLDRQAAVGASATWNPLEDFGVPVVADAGTSELYPLRWIFALRFVSFPLRFNLYLLIHVWIASIGAFVAARALRLRPESGAFASVTYAYGGPLLFQTCNLVFLIGAAWLPWFFAVLALLRRLWRVRGRLRRPPKQRWTTVERRIVILGAIVISLMIAGGDPQSAYHSLAILFGMASVAVIATIARHRRAPGTAKQSWPAQIRPLVTCCILVASAASLSAAAWLPAMHWNQRSERKVAAAPRTIWGILSESLARGSIDSDSLYGGLFAPPRKGTHHDHIYQFSQTPWSVGELIWPNISGKLFPTHRRWTAAIPGADRVWNASLYLGAATLLLLVAVPISRRFQSPTRWALVVILVFGVGSLGWYGPVWLGQEIGHTVNGSFAKGIGPQVGGVYWLMASALPLYDQFRYPGKLWMVAALGLSLLAAFKLESLRISAIRRFRVVAAALIALSAVGWAATYWPGLAKQMSQIAADPDFGPFDVPGALRDLRVSFLQVLAVTSVCLIATWLFVCRVLGWRGVAHWILMTTVVDLTMAGSWLVPRIDVSILHESAGPPPAAPVGGRPRRIFGKWQTQETPETWRQTSSPQRLAEILTVQRQQPFPKLNLLEGVGMYPSFHSITPYDLAAFYQAVDEATPKVEAVLGKGCRLFLGGDSQWPAGLLLTDLDPSPLRQSVAINPVAIARFQQDIANDLQRLADQWTVQRESEVEITDYQNDSVSYLVQDASSRVLVTSEYWDPGWSAVIEDLATGERHDATIVRFAGVFRAVVLPRDGPQRVTMQYRPPGWLPGWLLSVGTGLILLAGFASSLGTVRPPGLQVRQ